MSVKDFVKQTVTVSFNQPQETDWIKSDWNYYQSITVYYKQTEKMQFYIHFRDFNQLINKLAFNFSVLSLMLREDYLLVHGMLLNNGDVIVGQAYAGKTTLSRRLNLNEGELKALCDDQVLIDLKNKLAYPVPYFYFDPNGLFNNVQVDFTPVPINRVLLLKQGTEDLISTCSVDQFIEQIYKCSIVFLSQPFAQREQVFCCQTNKKWISFKAGLQRKIKKKIKQLVYNYFIHYSPMCFTFHI